ncbi:aldose epimerase family protein [Penaeicola halotolerans]|uniref:aldose epimerase family protein n=1 Tax=Penaeicola halotolerans TaxID=2793196 RepID=UPI001CF80B27|nr:aldose epimerase family protein [Penaeicola halotolerans]
MEGIIAGKPVQLYTLKNSKGIEMTVSNFGAKVVTLFVPDRDGKLADIVLGYDSLKDYQKSAEPYFGAAIGRYGNRIANGEFTLDGKTYQLAKNNGPNSLHGGPDGFHNVVWEVVSATEQEIVFSYTSVDGEEGFPGTLSVLMTYALTEEGEFKITYEASTDKQTVVNLTHHSFFNLNGAGSGEITDHILTLNASAYTPVDSLLIPTGEIASVGGTPMDFRSSVAIGERIEADFQQLAYGKGYDHNWVLDKEEAGALSLAATVIAPANGRKMEVYTTEPGIQFYSGNFLDGSITGKEDKAYTFRSALCLETQHFPDSPNQANFPSTVLNPGETYTQTCIYKFSVVQ